MELGDETVLVAGASGDTGTEILDYLKGTEAEVKALTRSEERSKELFESGADEVVVGDLFDPDDADEAVTGVDVVLSAVGSNPKQILTEDEFVDGAGNVNLARAADESGVRHFVMESAIGVGDEQKGIFGASLDLVLSPIQEAKADAEKELNRLDLCHTVLRPGALSPVRLAPSPQVTEAGSKLWGGVSRKTVAELMAAAPYTPEAENETFEVVENVLLRRKDLGIDWEYPASEPSSEIQVG
jgi:uncharacterized protein YbjT (DUF2867 family)